MPGPSQTRAYFALLLIATLWGTFPSTAKLALRDFPPIILGTVRCVIASLFLVTLLWRAGADAARGLEPASVRAFAILGLFGIVGSTQITYLALDATTAANAVILQATTPAMVALGGGFAALVYEFVFLRTEE